MGAAEGAARAIREARVDIFYSPQHALRDAFTELDGGRLVRPYERPARAEMVREELARRALGPIHAPSSHGRAPLARVHDAAYLAFLETVWDAWSAKQRTESGAVLGEVIANIWPSRAMGRTIDLSNPALDIEVRIGWHALAADTSLTRDTWAAAQISADVALSAYDAVAAGARAAFGLCRPPGHHASADMFGGYCFLNNAALVAQAARDAGAARAAVLDVDFHHGNGTQSIFYDRADVLTVSLHGDPDFAFPYFLGAADETGAGAGEGANLNLPMPEGTDWSRWSRALETACARVASFAPDLLVVSLGVDAFEGDPISGFRLTSGDFTRIGARIAQLGAPTVFLLEGGYAVSEIGVNVANTLEGFAGA